MNFFGELMTQKNFEDLALYGSAKSKRIWTLIKGRGYSQIQYL